MNTYEVNVSFKVLAENAEQAFRIVGHEVQKTIPFKGVPYSETDSGIINFSIQQLNSEDTKVYNIK